MLRRDGEYEVYLLEHQLSDGVWQRIGDGGHFSEKIPFPEYDPQRGPYIRPVQRPFTACGSCWQSLGVEGSFDRGEAVKFLLALSEHNPGVRFRVVCVRIRQATSVVTTLVPWNSFPEGG